MLDFFRLDKFGCPGKAYHCSFYEAPVICHAHCLVEQVDRHWQKQIDFNNMKISSHEIFIRVCTYAHSANTELANFRQVASYLLLLCNRKLISDVRVARKSIVFTVDREVFTLVDRFSD